MKYHVMGEIFELFDLLAQENKQPKDYGSGQLLYHSEVTFLGMVYAYPQNKAGDLAERLGVTKGAATQTAAKLAQKGHLEIYHKAGNKKEKFYRPTPSGEAAQQGHEEFHAAANKMLCAYISSLSDEERSVIIGFLGQLKMCMPFSEFHCEQRSDDR